MKGMIAVVKKDWKSLFFTPMAYVILGAYALMMGFYYTILTYAYMRNSGRGGFGEQASLDMITGSLLHANSYIISFAIPFLTMYTFAGEKRQQTFELLFTSPIKLGELVAAKFLGVFGLIMIFLSLSIVYFGFLFAWGNPELNVVLSGMLGLVLLCANYVALGVLISSFFSTPVLAAVVGFFLMLILWVLPSVGQLIYFKFLGIEIGPFLAYLTPQGHFKPFVDGIIYAKHVWFYLSSTVLLLFLTSKVVESNRWR